MKRTFYLIAVVLLVLSGSSTIAANVTWTGAGDGVSWSDPNNWSNNVVPGPTSDVIIGMVPGNPTIRITTAVQIHSLTSSEPINISAGSLTLAAPSSIDAAFIISNATLKVTGAGASFDATGPATVTDATFNAENGATVSFTSATLLTRVDLSATGGSKLLFPAVQTYADGVRANYTIQASGAGSKIDLSHLTSMAGSDGTFGYKLAITASTGGEVDLGGAITGDTVLTLSDATSVLNVGAVTSLQDSSVVATAGTVNFSALTTLARVSLSAAGGGKLLFPVVQTYADGVRANYTIQASGPGSRIDLSHLTSMAGSDGTFGYSLTVTAAMDGEVDLAGAITGNTYLNQSGVASVLNVSSVASLSGTTLTAANGAVWVLPSSWNPILGAGVVLTTTGSASQIINQGTLGIASGQLSINTDGFVDQGVLDSQNGGTIAIDGSFRVDDPGILKGMPGGSLSVTGDLLGDTHSGQIFTPQNTITFQGTGTPAATQHLEAMSQDFGAVAAGLIKNFSYGNLTLGNNTRLQLVDQSDNSPGPGAEAVYAFSILVPVGCTVDLNGLHLYARALQVLGTVLNGTIIQVPDTGLLTLATPTPGQLSSAGELDEWTLFGRGGRTLTVQVNPVPAVRQPRSPRSCSGRMCSCWTPTTMCWQAL